MTEEGYAKGGWIDPHSIGQNLILPGCTFPASTMWATQHTYSPLCDGLHPAGPCPEPEVTPMTYAQALAERDAMQ